MAFLALPGSSPSAYPSGPYAATEATGRVTTRAAAALAAASRLARAEADALACADALAWAAADALAWAAALALAEALAAAALAALVAAVFVVDVLPVPSLTPRNPAASRTTRAATANRPRRLPRPRPADGTTGGGVPAGAV